MDLAKEIYLNYEAASDQNVGFYASSLDKNHFFKCSPRFFGFSSITLYKQSMLRGVWLDC